MSLQKSHVATSLAIVFSTSTVSHASRSPIGSTGAVKSS
jgi:hypothetical protein